MSSASSAPWSAQCRPWSATDRPLARSTLTRSYATTVEDLWDAATSKERIPRWFLPVSGRLELGGRYQLEGNAGGTIRHCERPSYLEPDVGVRR